ncbi:hypothetical protein DSO57_1010372 [Entomophthora muscae]|uniref:Uncharacterized protein n=1 Tax=Entomophthora muscae TaxID=34485 RepID=A0ACC2USA1_9FUNG|nr:hypothetical protein DSO57_1010372 [Entomophthora muscae]
MVDESQFPILDSTNDALDFPVSEGRARAKCDRCKNNSLSCIKSFNGPCQSCIVASVKCSFRAYKKEKYTYSSVRSATAMSHRSGSHIDQIQRNQFRLRQLALPQNRSNSSSIHHKVNSTSQTLRFGSTDLEIDEAVDCKPDYDLLSKLPQTIIDHIALEDGHTGRVAYKKPVPQRFKPPNATHKEELLKTIEQNASILEWHVGLFLDRTTRDLIEIMFRRMRDPYHTNLFAKELQQYLLQPINQTTIVLISCMAALGALLLYYGPLKPSNSPFVYHTAHTYGVVPSQTYETAVLQFMKCYQRSTSDLNKLHLSYTLLQRVQPYIEHTNPISLPKDHPLSKYVEPWESIS